MIPIKIKIVFISLVLAASINKNKKNFFVLNLKTRTEGLKGLKVTFYGCSKSCTVTTCCELILG